MGARIGPGIGGTFTGLVLTDEGGGSRLRSKRRELAGEVSATERDRIAGNIKRAFDACGYDLQVQEPFDWGSVALRPPHQPGELLISSCVTLVAVPSNVLAIGSAASAAFGPWLPAAIRPG